MKTTRLVYTFALIAAAALLLSPRTTTTAYAQEAPAIGFPPEKGTSAFNLNFSGGTVESLLAEIEQATGVRPNVIVPNGLKEAHMPSFKLNAVSLADLFGALSLATDYFFESETGKIWVVKGPDENVTSYGYGSAGKPRPSRPTAGVGGGRATSTTLGSIRPLPKKKSTQVVGIGELLTTFGIEDVTTAILKSWENSQPEHLGKIAFHEDSSLLILTGDHEQLDLATGVIGELNREAERRKPKPKNAASHKTTRAPTPTSVPRAGATRGGGRR